MLPRAQDEQLTCVLTRSVSLRRACGLMRLSTVTVRDRRRLPRKNMPVLAATRELAAQFPRSVCGSFVSCCDARNPSALCHAPIASGCKLAFCADTTPAQGVASGQRHIDTLSKVNMLKPMISSVIPLPTANRSRV